MAFWKQALLSIIILAAAAAAWVYISPDAAKMLGFGKAANEQAADASKAGGAKLRVTLVKTAPVTTSVINDRLVALGDGQAVHSVTVLPYASGTLTGIAVAPGAKVKKGDVIAKLDSDAQEIALKKAELALENARATLGRDEKLAASNTVSGVQLQADKLAADNAALALQSAQVDLRNRIISAPIDGTIGIVQVDAGNAVTTQTVIASIEDRSEILISFWVPERFIGSVRVGDAIKAVPVARAQDTVNGTVAAVDNKVDSASGTFEVQASVPNPRDNLWAGMAFTVMMDFKGDSFPAVDPLAVQWGSEGSFVWRVTEGKAERVPVRIIQRNSENVLVSGDLKVGDAVITEGLDSLRPGTPVEIQGGQADAPKQDVKSGEPGAASAKPGAGEVSTTQKAPPQDAS